MPGASDLRDRLGPIGVWANWATGVPLEDLLAAVREVEALGFRAFWFAETPHTARRSCRRR